MRSINFDPSISRELGIGLVELLVSMVIGLFIMAGVVQLFSTSSQNSMANAGAARIQDGVRYTFARIGTDIANSGNLGCISTSVNSNYVYGPTVENRLSLNADVNEYNDFSSLIGGTESATGGTAPAGLIANSTDTFVVRFVHNAVRLDYLGNDATSFTVDSADTNYPSLQQYQIALVSNCSEGVVFMITNDPTTSAGRLEHAAGVIAPDGGLNSGQSNFKGDEIAFPLNDGTAGAFSPAYLYAGDTGSFQYFIGTADTATEACDPTNAPENCSLFRRVNGEIEELLRGVHNMQVEYGRTTGSDLFYRTAAQVTAENNWINIDRLKVTLSFNSIENAVASGNKLNAVLTKDVTRTFNLPNQL